jgi:hypothetical protein
MDLISARIRALEIAMDNARNGTSFDAVIGNADKFAKFIISGTAPDVK